MFIKSLFYCYDNRTTCWLPIKKSNDHYHRCDDPQLITVFNQVWLHACITLLSSSCWRWCMHAGSRQSNTDHHIHTSTKLVPVYSNLTQVSADTISYGYIHHVFVHLYYTVISYSTVVYWCTVWLIVTTSNNLYA